MSKKQSLARAKTSSVKNAAAIPAGWSQLASGPTYAARLTRCSDAFGRYLGASNAAKMPALIQYKFGATDIEYGEHMTEFWLYDKGHGVEVIAVAFDRSLDRMNNVKPTMGHPNPPRKNDWHVTVGVHPDADVAPILSLNTAYTAIKQLVAYQLQLQESHPHPVNNSMKRQIFTAWHADVLALNLAQWPDQIFNAMQLDGNVHLDHTPAAAPSQAAFGHFPVATKRVQITRIT